MRAVIERLSFAILGVVFGGLGAQMCTAEEAFTPQLSAQSGEDIPTQAYLELAESMTQELNAFDSGDTCRLDAVWPTIDLLTFIMGHLLHEDELLAILDRLEAPDAPPVYAAAASAFWCGYGDERLPRRIATSNPAAAYEHLRLLTQDPSPLIRGVAWSALAWYPLPKALADPTAEFTSASVRIEALQEIAETCPDTATAFSDLVAFVQRMDSLDANETLWNELIERQSNPEIHHWAARFLSEAGGLSAELSDAAPPLLKYAHCAGLIQKGKTSEAYLLLSEVLHSQALPYDAGPVLNQLGMGLVRDGEDTQALEVFGILIDLYSDSALATSAIEHAQHLSSTLTD